MSAFPRFPPRRLCYVHLKIILPVKLLFFFSSISLVYFSIFLTFTLLYIYIKGLLYNYVKFKNKIKLKKEKKKKLKSLIRFHSVNKIDNYKLRTEGKKSKRIYRTSQNIRIINVFLESLLSESFPLLGVTVHLTSVGCPPTLC